MFKYSFRIKTTLLESLRSQKRPFKARLSKTCYKYLHLARIEFLSFSGALNEAPRHIVMYYMFKYKFWIKTTLRESLRSQKKKPFIGSI